MLGEWQGPIRDALTIVVIPGVLFVGKMWGRLQELEQRVKVLETQLQASALDRKELRDMAKSVEVSVARIEEAVRDMKERLSEDRNARQNGSA